MQKFEATIPSGRVTVPSLPPEIAGLYPSAFYTKDGNPMKIFETKETQEEAFKSISAWYACGNPDMKGFVLPRKSVV